MKKLFVFFVVICLMGMVSANEYTLKTIPNPKTLDQHNYVSNPDKILKDETVYAINNILDSLERKTGAEIAVVVVNSIGGEEIKSFATQLFNEWGVGKAKQDNGLLILFVLDQQKVTFETGYGLEGILPDAICKRIQVQTMIPEFKKGNYDAGFLAAIKEINSIILHEPVPEKIVEPVHWNEILPMALIVYLVLISITWLWIESSIRKIRKNAKLKTNIARYVAIKNEKKGIISLMSVLPLIIGFIGILIFSQPIFLLLLIPIPLTTLPAAIYANIKMRKIRKEPIPCKVCGGQMHILSEKDDDAYLKLSQCFEEQLHSIDYDVFVCDNCKNEAIFLLDKPSAYTKCPKCGTKAFILKDKKIIVSPTYLHPGTERITYHCLYCGYEENQNRRLPRLTHSRNTIIAGSIPGGIFSGGGGFGGGSFGGGMSGGGGATSGW
ncbi:MAG TPA: TPM domain-containing protein [Paludibacteraceae bacterium]|nr:TPM domain-containing protein [Paludibacteraceae bacterium]